MTSDKYKMSQLKKLKMDLQTIIDDEYELQYYKEFNTSFFIRSIKGFAVYDIKDSTKEEAKLIEKFLVSRISPKANLELNCVSKEFESVQKCFLAQIKEPLDKLKPIARAFFKIPSNIVLDEDILNEISKNDLHDLKEEESRLTSQTFQQSAYISILNSEISLMETLKPIKETLAECIQIMKIRKKYINENEKKFNELNEKIFSDCVKVRRRFRNDKYKCSKH